MRSSGTRPRPSGRSGSHRPPRAVFWLRRVAALGLVAVVVLVGVLAFKTLVPAVSSALGGGGGAVVTGTTEPSDPATPSSSTTGGPAGDCTAGQVAATVAPSSTLFTWGSTVTFTVQVRNVGTAACVVDGSDAARVVVVSQGKTPVWSSADCATGQRLLLLGPGDVDTRTVTWKRTRSAAHCATTAATQRAVGAGDYTVTVGLLGATSDPATLTLTPKPAPPTTPTPAGTTGSTPTSGATTPSGKATPSSTGTPSGPATRTTDSTTKPTGAPTSTSSAKD